MPEDYKEMYCYLFNSITDALGEIDAKHYNAAKEILIRSQLHAEEIYIRAGENSPFVHITAKPEAGGSAVLLF